LGYAFDLPEQIITTENATQVGLISLWGGDAEINLAWSPQGDKIAILTDAGIRLFDAHTLHETGWIEPLYSLDQIAYSPDGKLIAGSSAFKAGILLIEAREDSDQQRFLSVSGTLIEMGEVLNSVVGFAFSPDGRRIAAGLDNGQVIIWEIASGEIVQRLNGYADIVNSVAFSPDGKQVACASYDQIVQVWEVASGSLLKTLQGHTDIIWQVIFSPDGQYLASGGDDGLYLWRLPDGDIVWKDTTKSRTPQAFSPNGALLFGADGTVWRAMDGELAGKLKGEFPIPSPDSASVATVDIESHLIMISPLDTLAVGASGVEIEPILSTSSGATGGIPGNQLAISPDSNVLALAVDDAIELRHLPEGSLVDRLEIPQTENDYTYVTELAYAPDGKFLASGMDDGALGLWRLEDDNAVQWIQAVSDDAEIWETSIEALAFSPDGKTLASGAGDGTVRLWDLENMGKSASQYVTGSGIYSLAFSPDSSMLAVGTMEKLLVFRLSSKGSVATESYLGFTLSLSFSPDGQSVAMGRTPDFNFIVKEVTAQGLVERMEAIPLALYDLDLGEAFEVPSIQQADFNATRAQGWVEWVAFSKDGKLIFSYSNDLLSNSYTIFQGELVSRASKDALSYSPNTISLWSAAERKQLFELESLKDAILDIALSPDGRFIVTTSSDRAVRLWGVWP
jgi:WD40 repeat protein